MDTLIKIRSAVCGQCNFTLYVRPWMNKNVSGPLCRGDGWTFMNDSCYWLSSYDATYEEADGVCYGMVSVSV